MNPNEVSGPNTTNEFKNELIAKHGEVLTTIELQEKYSVLSFCAPFVKIERKTDKAEGYMQFTHMPRFYFDFQAI